MEGVRATDCIPRVRLGYTVSRAMARNLCQVYGGEREVREHSMVSWWYLFLAMMRRRVRHLGAAPERAYARKKKLV